MEPKDWIPAAVGAVVGLIAAWTAYLAAMKQIHNDRESLRIERLQNRLSHSKGLEFETRRLIEKVEDKISDVDSIMDGGIGARTVGNWKFLEPAAFSQIEITRSITDESLLEQVNEIRQQIDEIDGAMSLIAESGAPSESLEKLREHLAEFSSSLSALMIRFQRVSEYYRDQIP